MAIRVVIFPTLLLLVACFMPPSSMRQKYTTVFSSSGSIDDSVERNRAIISALVKHCWQRVTKLLPPSQSLAATSEELKATTVMLGKLITYALYLISFDLILAYLSQYQFIY